MIMGHWARCCIESIITGSGIGSKSQCIYRIFTNVAVYGYKPGPDLPDSNMPVRMSNNQAIPANGMSSSSTHEGAGQDMPVLGHSDYPPSLGPEVAAFMTLRSPFQ
jgi:hypothetical protein